MEFINIIIKFIDSIYISRIDNRTILNIGDYKYGKTATIMLMMSLSLISSLILSLIITFFLINTNKHFFLFIFIIFSLLFWQFNFTFEPLLLTKLSSQLYF